MEKPVAGAGRSICHSCWALDKQLMSWNVNLADMMLQESIGEFYRKISEMRTGTRLKWRLVKEKLLRHPLLSAG